VRNALKDALAAMKVIILIYPYLITLTPVKTAGEKVDASYA